MDEHCCDPLSNLEGTEIGDPTTNPGPGDNETGEGVYDPTTSCGSSFWPVIKVSAGIPQDVQIRILRDPNLANPSAEDVLYKIAAPEGQIPTSATITYHVELAEQFNNTPVHKSEGSIVTAGEDLLSFTIPKIVDPGIYVGNFIVRDDNTPVFSAPLYVEVAGNVLACAGAPLTIAQVRMFIRDSCAEDNRLLDDLEYSDQEIMLAMTLPVDYWNEQPPPIGRYTYNNFPFRYQWLNATAGLLMKQATQSRLRNYLPVSGGGLTVDDGRWREYASLGKEMWDDYRAWVRVNKISTNMQGAYGGFGGAVAGHSIGR